MEVLVCREVDRPDKSAYANVQGVPRAIQLDLVLFSNSTPVNTQGVHLLYQCLSTVQEQDEIYALCFIDALRGSSANDFHQFF